MKRFIFTTYLIILSIGLHAQLETILHQTFDIKSENKIAFLIASDIELIPWAGDQILTETNVNLYDASDGILEHFIKDGRYDIEIIKEGTTVLLTSKDSERIPIKTQGRSCFEDVKVKIYYPESFFILQDAQLVKR